MSKCDYCKREATRCYLGKNLCELHYLKENPERNRNLVDWEKIRRMRAKSFFSTAKELIE
ncbi:MAG: hypothetical protein JRI72_03970 [Deltaproteobacteria bacterium]|nr:hypothetical protein [Deltaproteobacteria bacterium]